MKKTGHPDSAEDVKKKMVSCISLLLTLKASVMNKTMNASQMRVFLDHSLQPLIPKFNGNMHTFSRIKQSLSKLVNNFF